MTSRQFCLAPRAGGEHLRKSRRDMASLNGSEDGGVARF